MLMLVLMTDLDARSQWAGKAKYLRWIISTTKQAINIEHDTTAGHFFFMWPWLWKTLYGLTIFCVFSSPFFGVSFGSGCYFLTPAEAYLVFATMPMLKTLLLCLRRAGGHVQGEATATELLKVWAWQESLVGWMRLMTLSLINVLVCWGPCQ